jgi:hypothetical protein
MANIFDFVSELSVSYMSWNLGFADIFDMLIKKSQIFLIDFTNFRIWKKHVEIS